MRFCTNSTVSRRLRSVVMVLFFCSASRNRSSKALYNHVVKLINELFVYSQKVRQNNLRAGICFFGSRHIILSTLAFPASKRKKGKLIFHYRRETDRSYRVSNCARTQTHRVESSYSPFATPAPLITLPKEDPIMPVSKMEISPYSACVRCNYN